MKALSYQVRLLEPLLATQLGAGEENSSQSSCFIPGSMLRGALVNLYLKMRKAQGREVVDPAIDPDCRRLFFEGATCYLNAYPVASNSLRTLPKPLSWYVEKEEVESDEGTIYDFAVEPQRFEGMKAVPGDFCRIYDDSAVFVKTRSSLMMHNASKDRMVREKERSTVYRYEAIAAGQVFGAVIISENIADLKLLQSLIDKSEIHIGGSRSAGYGRVAFSVDGINSEWYECGEDYKDTGDHIVITLLSDLILRDETGHFTTDLDGFIGCRHIRAYQAMKVTGGFNRKWGLPLSQAPALQAGSVFVYPPGGIDEATLRKYLVEGIGERRLDGFGRVAINLNKQETLNKNIDTIREVPPVVSVESLSEESRELACRLAARRLKNMLDQRLLKAIDPLSIDNPPENAQLNRLREVARQAWYKGMPELILNHLKNLRAAGEQFKRARVGGKSARGEGKRLYTWLNEGIGQEKIWADYLEVRPPRIAGVTAEITKALKLEYTVRLLEALLRKTIRERQEGGAL
jgi:CRISPR-associated protein Csx10